MLARLSRHLTYTNVIATVAVFLALGGVSWAAIKVPRNSVGSKQLKAKAVTLSKIHPDARALFTGPKGDKGLQGLRGPVGPLPPSEPLRAVGEPGQPAFELGNSGGDIDNDCVWSNFDGGAAHSVAAFFKDPAGLVHVKGLVKATDKGPGTGSTEVCNFNPATSDNRIFQLPEGYRPSRRLVFATLGGSTTALMRANVDPNGFVSVDPTPNPDNAKQWVSIEGISFRAEQ
jgi:hypothetical protein